MRYSELLSKVQARAALDEASLTERAVAATLETLGECLAEPDARRVAEQLPKPAADLLLRRGFIRDMPLDEFYRRVSVREGVAIQFAAEHAQAVCSVAYEILDDTWKRLLPDRLPDAIAPVVTARAGESHHPHLPHHERHTHANGGGSLAGGRPGGQRPLSEAGAELGAHSDSVARSRVPHGDTQLSTTRGISSERDHDTLAQGRPGSKQPVSESKPEGSESE